MKILEQILLEIDVNNLAKTINDIHGQLEYYAKNKMEVEGISLMPIRDLLDPKYTDAALRNNGYILTIAQFREDCQKFLELAAKNPILYNSRLKRLHRSYQVLIENYIKGTVSNKAVSAEITQLFAHTLLASYTQGIPDNKKMPSELCNRIAKMVEVEIENHNKNWYAGKLNNDNKDEFTSSVAAQLLDGWRKKQLDAAICKQLDEEKNKINTIEAILVHYREKKLTQKTQDDVKSAIIEELKKDIDAKKLIQSSALGAQYNNIYNNLLDKNHYNIVSQIIENWQNKQVTADVSAQLEKYICDILTRMKPVLESSNTQEFEQLATRIFIDKLLTGHYSKDLYESVQKYSLIVAKSTLMSLTETELNHMSKCKNTIYTDVMLQLHHAWLNGKLSQTESEFIKEGTFASLNELDDKIQERVWPNKNKQDFEKLAKENAEMRSELSQMKALLQQLVSQKQDNTKSAATGSSLTNPVEHSPAVASASLGLFGMK